MDKEPAQPAKGAEQDVVSQTEYEQSAKQLLDLLVTVQDESTEAYYYIATWSTEQPTHLEGVRLMTATATGARRQERWGQFHHAQFRLDESDGITRSTQFIWRPTRPQYSGEPITLDEQGLTEEFAYKRLTPDNIAQTLSARTESIDDSIALVRLMEHHGVTSSLHLELNVKRAIYDLAYYKIKPSKVFELIDASQRLDPQLSKNTQGHLVSVLLRAICNTLPGDPEGTARSPVAAAAILEEALQRGVISHEHRTVDRILARTEVYEYPFATSLLLAHLGGDGHMATKRIFGISRFSFAQAYILAVIKAAVPVEPDAQALLPANDTQLQSAEQRLHYLLQDLNDGWASSIRRKEQAKPQAPNVKHMTDEFSYIVDILHKAYPTTFSEDFAQQSIEAVETLLAPLLLQELGKRAVGVKKSLEK